MNEHENNFESLRQLLALKRHEVPPPGYFDTFSSEVTARICAGEGGAAKSQALELSWLFRLLSVFEAKPAFAGSFASALCLLLLFGIVYAERPDVTLQPLLPTTSITAPGSLAVASPASFSPQPEAQPVFPSGSSTNPVFNTRSASAWMGPLGSETAIAQPVSFRLQ
jgi:hypothetical protein